MSEDIKHEAIDPVKEAANKLATPDVDVLFYNGRIDRPFDDRLITLCKQRNRAKNILLILVTSGGDPHAGYRMARCLQDKYEKFTVFIPGYCKSAGTLIALGAHEIVIADHGELGPLDMQVARADELEHSSGLTVGSAITNLQQKSFSMFKANFEALVKEGRGKIRLKTAMEYASNLTVGLFGKVYAQIDPLLLGEVARAMEIANHYGGRLDKKGKNIKGKWSLDYMTAWYPAHSCVIDRAEATLLFKNVRPPSVDEDKLVTLLGDLALDPVDDHESKDPIVQYLSDEKGGNFNGNGQNNGKDTSREGGAVTQAS